LGKTVCAIARLKIIKFLIHVDTRGTKATQLLILLKGQRGAGKDMQLAIRLLGSFAPLPACHTRALSQRFMLHEGSDEQTNGPQILQSEWSFPLFTQQPRVQLPGKSAHE